jgi:hypothetical protein
MINKFKEVNWNPTRAERKRFSLLLIAGSPCMAVGLSLITRFVSGHWNFHGPLMVAACGFTVAAISWLLPAVALPVYRVWYFLVCVIDTLLTYVVLTLLFYLVICPAGLLYQLFNRAALQKRYNPAAQSYWHDVQPMGDVSRYYRQY